MEHNRLHRYAAGLEIANKLVPSQDRSEQESSIDNSQVCIRTFCETALGGDNYGLVLIMRIKSLRQSK